MPRFTRHGRRDAEEIGHLQAGAADQRSVDIRLGQQGRGVVRLDAAAVLNPHRRRKLRIVTLGKHLAKIMMHFLGLLGRGDPAGADRPNRLVGDHQPADLLRRNAGQRAVELPADHFVRAAGFAIGQQLADANDRRQPGGQCGQQLLVHLGIGFLEQLPPLAVAENDEPAAEVRAASPG